MHEEPTLPDPEDLHNPTILTCTPTWRAVPGTASQLRAGSVQESRRLLNTRP